MSLCVSRFLGVLAGIVLAAGAQTAGRSNVADLLGFERGVTGWSANPKEDISPDEVVFHGGARSVRLERKASSGAEFSGVLLVVPVDFSGSRIELSGFVRTEDVSGFAGMWMRLDGRSGPIAFDSMQKLNVHGTNDWKEYKISIPVEKNAQRLFFGFLVSGSGKAWIDDMRLMVDGRPIADAPVLERLKTVLDTDRKFDGGSGIVMGELTAIQIENLTSLGKLWGFLKYHHPEVAAGKRHWDYDLFRILPEVLKAADREAGKVVMARWVQSLGEVKECTKCSQLPNEQTIHLRPELDWIDKDASLLKIYRNRPVDEQFYVTLAPNVRNPNFEVELPYAGIKLPDAGFQLLGLFRYWNMIRYWAPYRDVIGEDWDGVLKEFIPKIAPAMTGDEYKVQFLKLIARIHDTHANLWSSLNVRPPVGACKVPMVVRVAEGRFVVSGGQSSLKRGDVIEALDGVAVSDLIEAWRPYYADSNDAAMLRDMGRSLTNGPCGEVKLRIRRGEEVVDLSVARVGATAPFEGERTHDLPGETFRLLSKDVAYVKISTLKSAEVAKCIEAATGTKGLVIDIRNYPSDFPIFQLGGRLVEKETPFARFTVGDLGNPGVFVWNGRPVALMPLAPRYAGKVVVLVDEVSQSSAEYHAMAFRAAGGIVIGSTTAGADGNVSRIALPGGLNTMISGIGVFYPDKTPTQRVGIVPDRVVVPTIKGIREGRDEVLDAAIREIVGVPAP